MGKRILENALKRPLSHVTELAPAQLTEVEKTALPKDLFGRDFLAHYGGVDDPLSRIDPDQRYPVRPAVSFPIKENYRAAWAIRLLRNVQTDIREQTLKAVGQLMYRSHVGYSAMGLGCPETDIMVRAIRNRGPSRGFYGARVSGGGSGGTVVVLLEKTALPDLEELAVKLSLGGAGPAQLIA
jgi:L-arabinokinase